MTTRGKGLLFLLVGPPGVGKNALMTEALRRTAGLRQMTTATTRARRANEQHGREHFFVSHDEFHRMTDQNELLEWQEIHGELYGTPHTPLERAIDAEDDLIADIDVLGANRLRQFYPNNVRLIFIQPPSPDVLKERMQARGESEPEIEKRMRRVAMEMQHAPECDYLITNDDKDDASETLYGVILAERSHREILKLREAVSEVSARNPVAEG